MQRTFLPFFFIPTLVEDEISMVRFKERSGRPDFNGSLFLLTSLFVVCDHPLPSIFLIRYSSKQVLFPSYVKKRGRSFLPPFAKCSSRRYSSGFSGDLKGVMVCMAFGHGGTYDISPFCPRPNLPKEIIRAFPGDRFDFAGSAIIPPQAAASFSPPEGFCMGFRHQLLRQVRLPTSCRAITFFYPSLFYGGLLQSAKKRLGTEGGVMSKIRQTKNCPMRVQRKGNGLGRTLSLKRGLQAGKVSDHPLLLRTCFPDRFFIRSVRSLSFLIQILRSFSEPAS